MAKNDIDRPIPDIDEPWENYIGSRVEEFVKKQLNSKVGYYHPSAKRGTDEKYHLYGFASREDCDKWLADPVANASLMISDVSIPEDAGGVSDIVTLRRESADSIVTAKAKAYVDVSYLWRQYNPITQETVEMSEDATVVVQVRTRNANDTWGTWQPNKEFSVGIQTGRSKRIDLSHLLTSDATYQIRLVATGETSGITAAPVTVTVVYSKVSASYAGSIATPCQGESFQLPFRISGTAEKQLCIRIGDYTRHYPVGTTTYSDSPFNATLRREEFHLTRGSVKAEAWIAFGDGFTAETEHIPFQFIYIPEGDTQTSPILAVSDVTPKFENWTRATIFRYAVYNPTAESTKVRIKLQDRDNGKVYIERDVVCTNTESYTFDDNFALEHDDQPSVINAKATFSLLYDDGRVMNFGNSFDFEVDNRENFAYTKGATLIVSAEKKLISINGTQYELAELLRQKVDTNTGWKTSAEKDSTGRKVDLPVLSIGAGNRLTLPYVLFDGNTGHNKGGVEGSVTMEFDIKVKNIVDNAAVVDASAPFGSAYTGLKFYPTRAVCLSQNNISEDTCDVIFQEEVREHIAVNIIRNLRGQGLNLVRIYVNGKANRSYMYDQYDSFIPAGSQGAQNIVIGSDDADIDIYNIRIYKGQQLGSAQIQNDYMAGMATIEDKKLFKRFNSIFNGEEISYEQCNALGLNTILRRIPEGGHFPSRLNPSKQTGVNLDVRIYSERGNADSLDTKHSGTFTDITVKGQGTSAMGYYWWNSTDGFEETTRFNSLDGISQVDTTEYEIEDGRGGISKIVGKANYASPMQSHKLGAIWAYDELWQRLVNNGSNGRHVFAGTHATCYEKPFLSFYQIGDGSPVFCGFNTWGSGKGDKKTFGYDKKKSPDYLCISGADNGAIAALFQMPWVVSKNADGAWEGNIYPASVIINTGDTKNGYCYRSGNSDTLAFEVEIGSKYDGGEEDKGKVRITDEAKGGTENTLFTAFAETANFVFGSTPLIKPFVGTEAELITDSGNLQRDHQYWLLNSGSSRFNVYYFNPASDKFEKIPDVIPTAFGEDGRGFSFGSPKINEQLADFEVVIETVSGKQRMTVAQAVAEIGMSDADALNDVFRQGREAFFAAHAASYFDITDAVFHQTFLKLIGGTDNRTKNIYYWIDPAVDKRVRFKQDDLDTILATDNQGRQTKPYHVLEHTKDESGSNYWNGENNVFFTLLERCYNSHMRNMMRDIFTHMTQISGSVDNYFQERFYWVQEYFPAVAYNEASRVLYEAAQVLADSGELSVSQAPITQAVGDQLECEKQFMNQRLPMLMSWCEYESVNDGSLTFRSVSTTSGKLPTYIVEYTAFQYIYPKLAIGGTMAVLYALKDGKWVNQGNDPYLCAPNETVRLVATTDSNTQLSLRWLHYAKSIGNLGTLPCGDNGAIVVSGKRLRKLECWAANGTPIEFHPKGISIVNCRNLEEVNFTNAASFEGSFTAELPRVKKLLLSGTGYTGVLIPKTTTIAELALPDCVYEIDVDNVPNLASLSVGNIARLTKLVIKGEHKLKDMLQSFVLKAYAQATDLREIELTNVEWTRFPAAALMWLQSRGAKLSGKISVDGTITLADKLALIKSYGDIDSATNPLFINYTRTAIVDIAVKGKEYMGKVGEYKFEAICTPLEGNDIAIVDGHPAIAWSLGEGSSEFASIDALSGVISVTNVETDDVGYHHTVKCVLTKINGSTLENEIVVAYYRRHPKIGDFAYADGTFDEVARADKTCVGLVYKLDEIWQGEADDEPIVFEGFNHPTEEFKANRELIGWDVRVDGAETIADASWGLYYDPVAGAIAEITQALGVNPVNVPALTDYSDAGWPWNKTYVDVTKPDGDGFLTLSGASNDWRGRDNTSVIVGWMKEIFAKWFFTDKNTTVAKGGIDKLPTTVAELSTAINTLKSANNNRTQTEQLFYPSALYCNLYQPTTKPSEALNAQYARSNWYLFSAAEAVRIAVYYGRSRTGGNGTMPNRSVIDSLIAEAFNSTESNAINENIPESHVLTKSYSRSDVDAVNRYVHSMQESKKPLYSLAVWRASVLGLPQISLRTTHTYHCSNERLDATRSQAVYALSCYSSDLQYPMYGSSNGEKQVVNKVRPCVIFKYLINENE